MLSTASQVDVILGLWKNIGLTQKEVSSSVSEIFGLITCGRVRFQPGAERHIRWIRAGLKLNVMWTVTNVG